MWKLCAAIFALASGSAVAQQLVPPTDQQAIVVMGNRNVDQQMRDFIKTVTVAERNYSQLSRFESPACPYVVGLGPSQDQMVAARILNVAEAIGVETGDGHCDPNVFVIIAEDKKATIRWLDRHIPTLMTNANGKPIVIPHDDSPATAWHVLGAKDGEGREAGLLVAGWIPTRVRPIVRPHFLASVLVVESRALKGLTTTELGDYAAMRAFAQLDPRNLKAQAAPTILTILDAPMDGPVPLTLTDWDLAFLHGLYASSLNQYALTQQREIQRSMRKELAEQRVH